MKWKQRIVFFLVLVSFGAGIVFWSWTNGDGKLSKKDTLSVGGSKELQKSMDIYPGKLRKTYDANLLTRELQGKSKSADQESPDQDDVESKAVQPAENNQDQWLSKLNGQQSKTLEYIVSKIYQDEATVNKMLKAAYLVASDKLDPSVRSQVNEEDAEMQQLKRLLQENAPVLDQKYATSERHQNVQQKRPLPARVPVSPEEIKLLTTLEPRDVRWAGRKEDAKMRKRPQKLSLSPSHLLSYWDSDRELGPHWKNFYTSINSLEMFPDPTKNSVADDLARHMATEEIVGVENMDGGTQVKLLFYFEDGGKAVFKPMRVTREKETDPDIFYWRDYERATAEVAAYHLDRVLDMRRTSPCVSRVVNITSEIWDLADRSLAKTVFISPANNVCFYGDCKYYCDAGHPVCGQPDIIDGSLCAWLPEVPRHRRRSPWRRSYSKSSQAQWETDDDYCDHIKMAPPYNQGRRLLDVMDIETFDFLMYNMDRHHVEAFEEFGNNTFFINLDNGRGFGTHSADELSILAPVYQCCVYRYSMLQKLLRFHLGPVHLGEALKRSLNTEAIAPVLIDEHFEAVDRRVNITLKAVAECVQTHGAKKVVFHDGY